MYKVHEILNPVKFSLLIIQVILTINISFTKSENIYGEIDYSLDSSSSDYTNSNNSIIICLVLFYLCQAIEIIFIFLSESLFLNGLNSFIILFHCISTILLTIFILDSQAASDIWGMWIIGGLIPMCGEIYGSYLTRSRTKSAKSYNN